MKELKDLVVGDEIIVAVRTYSKTTKFIGYVDRITKASIFVNGLRFRKKDGFIINDVCNACTFIEVGTEEDIKKIETEMRHRNFSSTLNDFNFFQLSLEKLQKIMDIIKE